MKKIRWSTFSSTEVENSSNRIVINGDIEEPQLKVIIIDKENNEVKRYMDIKMDQHKVLIIPKFQWKITSYEETDSDNIEYAIKRADDCWEIDGKEEKLIVKPGKKAEFEKTKKEMHKKLLAEKFDKWIDFKGTIEGTGIKYRILPDVNGNYSVKIYQGDSSRDREFEWEKVEIEPNYWQNKMIDFSNAVNVVYQEEEAKKSQLTTPWIIFFVILAAVVILIIVFWKKIWKWIKGEREQEKKVREQLDIF